jgi:hypothetical protein
MSGALGGGLVDCLGRYFSGFLLLVELVNDDLQGTGEGIDARTLAKALNGANVFFLKAYADSLGHMGTS